MDTWHVRLTRAREKAGLSKAELARRVKVSGPTVTDWEKGEIQALDAINMLRICDALDCTPHWLMFGKADHHAGVNDSPGTYLSPRHQKLLDLFDGLTSAQQEQVIIDLDAQKSSNEDLLAQLLARKPRTTPSR